MISVTANAFHEKLDTSDEEIILNGPPSFLSGNIFLNNQNDEVLFIHDLPMQVLEASEFINGAPLQLNTALQPGEQRNHFSTYQVHPNTPPGTYISWMTIGGKEKKVRMVVQEHIDIDVRPNNLFFQKVKPNCTYDAELLISNRGNVAVTVPEVKHNTTLDFDYFCRGLSFAIRKKGNEGFMSTMDELTKNIFNEMAGWVIIKIRESGQSVNPGTSMALHLSITLPENVDPRKDYYGDIRLWETTVTYKIKS